MKWHLRHEQFGDQPWAVQQEAINRCGGRSHYGYFLEQGLGKTAVNLNDFIDADDCDINVVCAPSSFVGDWPLAPAEWGLGFLSTGQYDGKDGSFPFEMEQGVWSISHETLRGSDRARRNLLRLLDERRVMFTLDEATGIKNPQSKLAKFMMSEVAKRATRMRLLDGTPMVQNVMDYYAKLRCLRQLNGVNPYSFRNRYALMGGFMGKQVKGIRAETKEELAALIDGCAFRALKKDWRKDMPPQLDVPVHLEMTDRQRKAYRSMMEEFYVEIKLRGDVQSTFASMVLTQRQKCQQISSCFVYGDDRQPIWIEPPERNPKLKAVFDIIDSGPGKVIVSYIFEPSGRLLVDQLQKAKLQPAFIMGGMKSAEIVEQKKRFNDDTNCRVIVGQQDLTSRGHTLIGQKGVDRCSRTIYYENSPSLMHRLQMNDRNHRGAQDETCLLYDLICNSVDENQIAILTGKKSEADAMDALIKMVRERKWD